MQSKFLGEAPWLSRVNLGNCRANGSFLTRVNLAVQSPPFGRVLVFGLDVLERDREVDEIEIKIVNAPEAKLFLGSLFDLDGEFLSTGIRSEDEFARTCSFAWYVFQSYSVLS